MDSNIWQHVEKHSEVLLRELHAEMRSIRDADLKLLPFFFTICAFVLSANLLTIFNANAEARDVLWVAVPSILFVCIFWWQLHDLIEYNHKKYLTLGQRVREIWDKWEVVEFCEPSERKSTYGAGRGYRKTQLLIATSAISVVLIVAATQHHLSFVHDNRSKVLLKT